MKALEKLDIQLMYPLLLMFWKQEKGLFSFFYASSPKITPLGRAFNFC